jgi:hypothetical protein
VLLDKPALVYGVEDTEKSEILDKKNLQHEERGGLGIDTEMQIVIENS